MDALNAVGLAGFSAGTFASLLKLKRRHDRRIVQGFIRKYRIDDPRNKWQRTAQDCGTDAATKTLRCDFCSKPDDNVWRLVAGPRENYICDDCALLCLKILSEDAYLWRMGYLTFVFFAKMHYYVALLGRMAKGACRTHR